MGTFVWQRIVHTRRKRFREYTPLLNEPLIEAQRPICLMRMGNRCERTNREFCRFPGESQSPPSSIIRISSCDLFHFRITFCNYEGLYLHRQSQTSKPYAGFEPRYRRPSDQGLRLRPLGHWDRLRKTTHTLTLTVSLYIYKCQDWT
jgi:hypothetical protein